MKMSIVVAVVSTATAVAAVAAIFLRSFAAMFAVVVAHDLPPSGHYISLNAVPPHREGRRTCQHQHQRNLYGVVLEFTPSSCATDHVASLFLDAYARPENKRGGGAWTAPFIQRSRALGRSPVVFLNCNLPSPVGDRPSLLPFKDVKRSAVTYLVFGVFGLKYLVLTHLSNFFGPFAYDIVCGPGTFVVGRFLVHDKSASKALCCCCSVVTGVLSYFSFKGRGARRGRAHSA